jgi:hypothetical protein
MSAALGSGGLLGRVPCIHARLHRLGTKPGEEYGLIRVYKISALKYSCEKARLCKLVPTKRLAEFFFKEFGLAQK